MSQGRWQELYFVSMVHLSFTRSLNPLTLLVPVRLDVPVSVDITRLVVLDTSSLNLLETPLRQVDIASTKVTSKVDVPQPEGSCQGTQLRVVPR
jgi:hypothetical protein